MYKQRLKKVTALFIIILLIMLSLPVKYSGKSEPPITLTENILMWDIPNTAAMNAVIIIKTILRIN